MNIVTVYHAPNGKQWEVVETLRTPKTKEQIAAEYAAISHHGVKIEGNCITLAVDHETNALMITVEEV